MEGLGRWVGGVSVKNLSGAPTVNSDEGYLLSPLLYAHLLNFRQEKNIKIKK